MFNTLSSTSVPFTTARYGRAASVGKSSDFPAVLLDQANAAVSIEGMVAVASPDREWLTVSEAAALAGCTQGWVRLLLGDGRLAGWKAGARAWLIRRADAEALKGTLTSRSVGRREATRKPVKRKKSR